MKLYVLKGMTQREVLEILGKPYKKGTGSDDSWYYGGFSLVFDDPRGIAEEIKEIENSTSKAEEQLSKLKELAYGGNPPRNEKYQQLKERSQERQREALQEIYRVKTVHISDSCL
jgi:outer membrane protein assembly factor BamE (lipoprotein component of BamABCDE complex)